jgi:choline dehydrogenase
MSSLEQPREEFDFVIVGSGAGGGPLSVRLAEAGFSVLVLEAGGDHPENLNSQVPSFSAAATEDVQLTWNFYINHYTNPELQKLDPKYLPEEGGILYPRSGAFGGCPVHNTLITIAALKPDWDGIAELTADDSWRADRMQEHFRRMEACHYGPGTGVEKWVRRFLALFGIRHNPSRHGYQGWFPTRISDPAIALRSLELLDIIITAAWETVKKHIGHPLLRLTRNFDPNDWRIVRARGEGFTLPPLNTDGEGRRFAVAEYLHQSRQRLKERLEFRCNALASRILFAEGGAAEGVEYLAGAHLYRADPHSTPEACAAAPRRSVYARREVIVCAGAFNTPQLLKLSGIGPREELERHGIEVRVDLPGVGENLQDRYEVSVVSEVVKDFSILRTATFTPDPKDPNYREWERGKGIYTSNGVLFAIVQRSQKERPNPDLFTTCIPGIFKGYFPGFSELFPEHKNYFSWVILKAYNDNICGSVLLRSADPCDTPDINFKSFDDGNDIAGQDMDSVVDGIEFFRGINRDLQKLIVRESFPGPEVATREQLRAWVRDHAWGHHASCSCRMGPEGDPNAVLDSRFRVRGTRNLRVVDASVFPKIPGYFIVLPIYMVSEKAAEVILEDARGR